MEIKLMKTEIQTVLTQKGITISVPPEVKEKKTIFARRVLPHVGTKTPDEIKTEIERHQNWAKINTITKIRDYTKYKKKIIVGRNERSPSSKTFNKKQTKPWQHTH